MNFMNCIQSKILFLKNEYKSFFFQDKYFSTALGKKIIFIKNIKIIMQRRGAVNLPLHGGHPPKWLFTRMVDLSGALASVIIEEYSISEFLNRVSNPYWFQAFSCVLGFDWHSSGTTTTTLGALKASLDPEEHGIYLTGGKGAKSRKTPQGIEHAGEVFNLNTKTTEKLVETSKLSAKIDNSCIQDGYTLYQHNFFVSEKGEWAVVQQGMNTENKYARRYHWLGSEVEKLLNDPHSGISCDKKTPNNKPTANEISPIIKVSKSKTKEIFLLDMPRIK